MPINIPNILTLTRAIFVPLGLSLHYHGNFLFSFFVISLSLLTDYLDGYYARKLNQSTHFGTIFDPIVDKFVSLILYGYIGYFLDFPLWFISIVLIRNFSQLLSIPILVWWLKKTFFVKPSRVAKWITGISDIFIFFPLFLSKPNIDLTFVLIVISLCEAYIFVTYVPRLIQIAADKHDTFT